MKYSLPALRQRRFCRAYGYRHRGPDGHGHARRAYRFRLPYESSSRLHRAYRYGSSSERPVRSVRCV